MSAPTTIFTEMTALAERTGAINLGQGFPDDDGPSVIVDAAVEALRAGHNQYAPLPGIPVLRQAIAEHQQRRYGLDVNPATGVQVTFGATEAIAASLLAFLEDGDEVIALDPSYDAYAPIARRAGARVRPIVLDPPGWRIEETAIEAALTDRTRVLVLNSPHNPTGRVLERYELELLAAVCRRHDLIAVTDEVYEHLVYDGTHVPLATLPGMAERTVTTSSLGKTHSLTGWKVGWASGPPDLIARVRGVKQFLTFAGGTPFQHAAAVGVAMPDEQTGELARSLEGKRDRLTAGLREVGFAPLPTAGTYFLNADAGPLGHDDARELCLTLPSAAGVAAIPVSAFSTRPERVRSLVRFAFCKRDLVLDEAVDRLKGWAGHG
ncbi:MAG TPA: aminotransferase class I/II-fold pyridoxal phosphate-dependent enzyme [Thermoleophilaceae bacterium]|nr:aminotransferase class I/II-fold pyridoxal phosphate-dependent enzyme [Thermoleophilaceae bacterium]